MQQIPVMPVPNQSMSVVLGGQQVNLNLYTLPQRAQTGTGAGDFLPAALFLDISVSNVPVCTCIPCFNLNKIVRGQGDFIGDFIFQDTQGTNDPTYDGLGSRYLLQYLEASDL